MGRCSREGVGIVRQGHEVDYFEFTAGEYIGMADLIEKASGVESPDDGVMSAYEFEKIPDADNFWSPMRETYRKESGRQYPPVYRVRITVEAEALSESETAAWWQKKQEG